LPSHPNYLSGFQGQSKINNPFDSQFCGDVSWCSRNDAHQENTELQLCAHNLIKQNTQLAAETSFLHDECIAFTILIQKETNSIGPHHHTIGKAHESSSEPPDPPPGVNFIKVLYIALY
jgi:hypothetical protein